MAEADKTDTRTVRRMAYRLSGTAVALSALNLPIHGISIEGVEDQGEFGKEGMSFLIILTEDKTK